MIQQKIGVEAYENRNIKRGPQTPNWFNLTEPYRECREEFRKRFLREFYTKKLPFLMGMVRNVVTNTCPASEKPKETKTSNGISSGTSDEPKTLKSKANNTDSETVTDVSDPIPLDFHRPVILVCKDYGLQRSIFKSNAWKSLETDYKASLVYDSKLKDNFKSH